MNEILDRINNIEFSNGDSDDLHIVSNCTLCNIEINYKGVCELCYNEERLNDFDC